MTETPGNLPGLPDPQPGYGATPPPVPPAPSGAGYPPPPAGYPDQPPAYQPPPAAPDYQQQPPAYSPPPVAPDYQQQPPAAGYQQQPPAAPGYQPPPAQGGFASGAAGVGQQFQNFDPKSLQDFDPRSVNPLDWGIIAAGLLAFIFSFFSFYTVKVSVTGLASSFGIGSAKAHENAWHGFFGWFGVLVAIVATLILAAELIAKIKFPFQTRLIVLGGFVLALICELLALLVVPVDTGGAGSLGVKVDKGHGVGYWLVLICVIVGTGLAFRRFTDSGGKLPSRAK